MQEIVVVFREDGGDDGGPELIAQFAALQDLERTEDIRERASVACGRVVRLGLERGFDVHCDVLEQA